MPNARTHPRFPGAGPPGTRAGYAGSSAWRRRESVCRHRRPGRRPQETSALTVNGPRPTSGLPIPARHPHAQACSPKATASRGDTVVAELGDWSLEEVERGDEVVSLPPSDRLGRDRNPDEGDLDEPAELLQHPALVGDEVLVADHQPALRLGCRLDQVVLELPRQRPAQPDAQLVQR